MTSPDSPALRKRRERAHKAGDHSLCRPEACEHAPSPNGSGEDVGAGEIEAAVCAHLDGLELDDGQAVLAIVARQVAATLDKRVTAAGARELRACLETLRELGGTAAAERSGRQAERMLSSLKELVR